MLGSHTTPAPLLVGKVTRTIGKIPMSCWFFRENGHDTLVLGSDAETADAAFDILEKRPVTIH